MLTEKKAKKLGYRIIEGCYNGTNDNKAGRYYIDKIDSSTIDCRGSGFKSKKAALQYLKEMMTWNRIKAVRLII